jgi:hemoglobin
MIDEEMIGRLVDHFYARIRQDPDLGPIFEAAVEDWVAHRALLISFWSAVMLKSGGFHGQPVQTHRALPDLTRQHFEIWLQVFADSAAAVCPPEAAAQFIDRSQRIGASLSRAVLDRTAP